MAIDFQQAHEADAFSLNDVVGLFAGVGLPWNEVTGAYRGSRYFRSNGEVYKKTGAGNLSKDWQLDTGQTIQLCFPFWLSNGATANIPMVSGQLSFTFADGTQVGINTGPC